MGHHPIWGGERVAVFLVSILSIMQAPTVLGHKACEAGIP